MDTDGRVQKEVVPKTNIGFVTEKYVKGVKQDHAFGPGLVQSMMKRTDPVKEALPRGTMNMHQF